MKVKKLLAGLSAAAMAASMLSMASFAEDEAATPAFGASFFVMGNGAWNWKSVGGDFDTELSVTGNAATLASESRGTDEAIGRAGVQLYVANGADFKNGDVIKGKFTYSVVGEGDYSVSDTVDFAAEVTDGSATKEVELFGYGADWAELEAVGDFTLTASVSEVEVVPYVEPEVESEYDVADAVASSTYAGDWAAAGLYSPDFDNIVAEDGMVVTVKYSLDTSKDWDQNAFAPMDQHGWVKLGDEWEFSQDGWEVDEKITKATVEEKDKEAFEAERDAAEGPFMKKDGFILLKDDGEVKFTLNEKMIEELKARAEENPGDDGSTWYGLGFQVYGVILDQVTYEYNINSPKYIAIGKQVSYNTSVTVDPAEYGVSEAAGFSKIKLGLRGLSAEDKGAEPDTGSAWNDWCTYKIKVTHADGSVDYVAVAGAQVGWDTTVDDNGTPDDKDDDVVIAVADCEMAESESGKVIVELDYAFGDTYEVIALGWDSYPDDPYIEVYAVAFDDEEIVWPEEPGDPGDPGDPESQNESSEESSEEESSKDESSNGGNSKPGNSGNNGGGNANTGAVALGLGVLTLAGAAVVVTKKKF